MRVPRNTHLSLIRSVRASFQRNVPAASSIPVSEEPPVESAPEVVAEEPKVEVPVVESAPEVVAEEPKVEAPEVVSETPAPPVKKTRKGKTQV